MVVMPTHYILGSLEKSGHPHRVMLCVIHSVCRYSNPNNRLILSSCSTTASKCAPHFGHAKSTLHVLKGSPLGMRLPMPHRIVVPPAGLTASLISSLQYGQEPDTTGVYWCIPETRWTTKKRSVPPRPHRHTVAHRTTLCLIMVHLFLTDSANP